MMCFRDCTLCNASCRCTRCDLRLDDAVRRAAAAWWDGQRCPVPLLIVDRSASFPDFVPDAHA